MHNLRLSIVKRGSEKGRFLFAVLICLFAAPAFGATLKVPTAYSTIAAAWNAAGPGDTVLVDSGGYTSEGIISPKHGLGRGTSANPVVIKAASRHGAVVTGFDCATGGTGVNGAYYTRFDGFHITGTGEAVKVAGPGTEIRNCKFTGLESKAISVYNTSPNLVVSGNLFYRHHYAIHPKSNNYTVNNAVIENNELGDVRRTSTSNEGDGFRVTGSGITIRGNWSWGNTSLPNVNHDDFIQTFLPGLQNAIIERNIVIGQTFLMANRTTETAAFNNNNVIRNNVHVIQGSRTSSGILISCGTGNKIYNNTIVNSCYGITILDYVQGGNSSATIYNNILVGVGYPLRLPVSANVMADHNLYYLCLRSPGISGDHDVKSNPYLVNSLNPLGTDGTPFTGDDGYRLQAGSPAINSGAVLRDYVAQDIFKTTRPQDHSYDIGPHEYILSGQEMPVVPSGLRTVPIYK